MSLWLASVTIGHVAGGFIEEAERVFTALYPSPPKIQEKHGFPLLQFKLQTQSCGYDK